MKIASELNLRNTENVERLEAFGYVSIGEFKNSISFEKFSKPTCARKKMVDRLKGNFFRRYFDVLFSIPIHRILILRKGRKS